MNFIFINKEEYYKIRMNTFVLSNLVNYGKTYLQRKLINKKYFSDFEKYRYAGFKFGHKLGKPPIIDKKTENNQGVWGWNDIDNGITWIYYSDAYKKNHYLGGSLEFSIANDKINMYFKNGKITSMKMAEKIFSSSKLFLDNLCNGNS